MLTFLKLGGSLITEKTRPYTCRPQKLEEIAVEIASALKQHPGLRLVIGHGSGSFGHQAASHFDTRQGVSTPEAWRGFAEVWFQASSLNRMVLESLRRAGLAVITVSPFASITAHDHRVLIWDVYPLQSILAQGIIPVVHGDVVCDDEIGGTILSTEDLFDNLARRLHPGRILLAGLEQGVWRDFPARKDLIAGITPDNFSSSDLGLGSAEGADVTGGMRSKVAQMLSLVSQQDGLEVKIFSGEEPGNVLRALSGDALGTRLHR